MTEIDWSAQHCGVHQAPFPDGAVKPSEPVSADSCWRCGGKPYEHPKLKPRRPVCAECALEMLAIALGPEFDEHEEATDETK